MIAQVAFFCAALALSSAGFIHPGGGASVSSRRQDDFGNYAFNYQIANGVGATNGRYEVGDGYGNKRGGYTLTDIDGRARRVEYVADGLGYRAVVKTNEPGTAASAPAAAVVNSPYAGPVAPVVAAGPVVPAAAAPLAYKAVVGAPAAYGAYGAYGPYGHGVVKGFY